MSAMGGWEEQPFGVWILCAREGLEAVGRKDLSRAAAVRGSGAGAGEGMDFGRALHRGRHAAGSMGQREEFSAQGQEEFASAGRSENPTVNFRGEKRSN